MAMAAGLVKSLVLDWRKGNCACHWNSNWTRRRRQADTERQPGRIMLRAGCAKLEKLEADFARIDPQRYPENAGGVRRHDGIAAGGAIPAG